TWDLKKLATETLNHYQASLQNIDSLTRTPVNTFEAIIQKGGGDREKYRPWLSDFLAHRALDFFTNGELAITRPAEIFTLDDEKYFLPYQDFKDLNINHPDRLSFSYQALRIFQQLLAAHVENSSPEALVDVELKRLDFVFQHSTLSNKVEKYYQALERLHRQYSTLSVSAEVAYKMALQLQIKGNSYHPFQNKKTQWELKKAIALCNSAIAVFPKSYGADQCRSLESRIFEKSIKLTTEKVNVPNLPFRALVSYKNINKIYLKAVKVDWDDYQKTIRHDRRDYFLQLNKRQSLKEWTVGWEDNSDYQPHSLEIKIDGMPKGFYILVAATSPDFNIDHEAATYTPFWVSNLSYLTRSDNAMNTDIFVFDRKTGEPIAGAKAELFYDKYSSITRNYTPKKINEYLTDKDGHIRVFSAALNDVNNYYINLSTSDDRLNTRDFQYHYSFYREEHKEIRTLFFTDRAIYRPGQSVFFKGLVFETDGKNNLIKTGHTSTVALYDVNNQKVSELIQITNEWGTFSGSFTVPNTGLTGQMYISDGQNRKYIAVEEYKRPKFEVVFNPVEGNFKVNEQIKVSGMATTYSGVALDEAEVSYRVVRNTHVPYSFYHWESHWPETPLVEITNGAIKTNDEGGFDITFPALPDAAISRDMQPTFQYTVYADVTDINGETHSSTTLVQVGYHALNLSVDVPETVNKSGKDRFALNTTNLNGQFVPASGNIKIWSLEEPKRYFRSRLWSQPDQHIIRETEYIKDFPHDVYKDEDDYRQWSKKIKVYDHDFNTKNSQEITLYKLPEWRAGRYILEATAMDAYGQEVKALNYITVFGENEKDCPVNEMGWFTPLKTAGEPGEIAEFLIGSVARNVKVLYEIEHDGTITHREWFTLHSGQKKVSLPIEEKHRGNFAVHFTFVKHGRNFRYGELIRVPYTNKQLDLTFETFRNKLLPGQKEEWRVKIKNKNGEKAAAEMLATMYDASLDAFAENDWPLNILKYHYGSYTWDDNSSFSVVNSTLFQQDWNLFKRFETRLYDKLDWFGYSFGHRYRYLQKVSSRFMEVTTEEPEEEIDFEFAANVEKDEDADELLDLDLKVNQSKPTLQKPTPLDNIQARTNFNETAFFYPHLTTNEAGEILISFTMPEALTRWKFMGLAHSKDLKTGQLTAETITQKDLMVYPNAPRFFREGDRMTFSSKITNLADKDLKGTAKIFFFNALNMQPIGAEILRSNDTNPFTLPHGKSTSVSW
ncbi:MAG: MG2 domain-containing protein, partial [Cyclobacteriaceae bacterium]|nr:MG2 domain-containing protein [Cyclobacteriaceae bacterium]